MNLTKKNLVSLEQLKSYEFYDDDLFNNQSGIAAEYNQKYLAIAYNIKSEIIIYLNYNYSNKLRNRLIAADENLNNWKIITYKY